jgi:hypothetical protein
MWLISVLGRKQHRDGNAPAGLFPSNLSSFLWQSSSTAVGNIFRYPMFVTSNSCCWFCGNRLCGQDAGDYPRKPMLFLLLLLLLRVFLFAKEATCGEGFREPQEDEESSSRCEYWWRVRRALERLDCHHDNGRCGNDIGSHYEWRRSHGSHPSSSVTRRSTIQTSFWKLETTTLLVASFSGIHYCRPG